MGEIKKSEARNQNDGKAVKGQIEQNLRNTETI